MNVNERYFRTFEYKDGNRVWWKFTIQKTDTVDGSLEPTDPDYWWRWTLENVDDSIIVAKGDIRGQYDLMPDINDILTDYQLQVSSLCLGMARYCDNKK